MMCERQVDIEGLISSAFRGALHDMRENGHRHYWFAGGRGSGKSTFVSLVIASGLNADKNANAVIYRRTANTLWDSVYKQMAWALDTLIPESGWVFRKTPMEIFNRRTGQRILFRGADDPMKSKGIRPGRGYFRYVWKVITRSTR